VLPTGILLLAFAEVASAAPALNLSNDAVPVPWAAPERRYGEAPQTVVVFVNFDGQTLNCENDFAGSNNSFLACDPTSLTDVLPFSPAGYSCGSLAGCKETIRSMLGARWSERWNIRFVTERPKDGDYEMAMVGGTFMPGILGIAPLDCSNANRNTVSFSFSNDIAALSNPEEALATTISHELGHALGQCHNDNMASVMFPSVDSGGGAQSWECGAAVGVCDCPGGTCPPDYFDDILGPAPPDTQLPVVQILAPLSGLRVPSQFTVRAAIRDDRTMDVVEVSANGADAGSAMANVSGLYDLRLPPLPPGHVRVCVVGRDASGNEGQDCINVTVDPAAACVPGDCCCGGTCCEQSETCDCSGRLPNGEPCDLDQDCRGGLCEDSPWDGESRGTCTESCAEDGECLPGQACVGRDAAGRGMCWSYVTAEGVGRPCRAATDCEKNLTCAYPDGCTEVPTADGVGDEPCLGDGFCSRPCGTGRPQCPERFACADVGDGRYCRFAGVSTEVVGGCSVAPANHGWSWLVALAFALSRRRR